MSANSVIDTEEGLRASNPEFNPAFVINNTTVTPPSEKACLTAEEVLSAEQTPLLSRPPYLSEDYERSPVQPEMASLKSRGNEGGMAKSDEGGTGYI